MTANKRIFLNVIATYGRSLYSVVIGLFSARWVLAALGAEDYGLYGVVGGLTVFIAFFNSLLAGAVGRYYAYSVGAVRTAEDRDLAVEECRKWFNSALCIHIVVPLCLMVVGYPLGEWAVRNWLTIRPDKIEAAVWVFRCVCVSCFVGMINVPFTAMYTAKQYIAELTLYGVAQTTLSFFFYFYMVSHPDDWLVRYAGYMCILSITPQLIICLRALKVFPECRINIKYMWNASRFKQLGVFAGWQAFGGLGGILSGQGMQILINKYFGTSINASMSVANNVNGHAQSLSQALQGAFAPAITQACGAKEYDLMKTLAFRSCKFSMLFSLIFVIPLAVEIDNVMLLWLKDPPLYVSKFCICMILSVLIEKASVGHMTVLNANGKIALYQALLGTVRICTLLVAWIFVRLDFGAYSVSYALVITSCICSFGRIILTRLYVGMSIRYWFGKVLVPVVMVTLFTGVISLLVQQSMRASFSRLIVSGCVCEALLLPLAWLIVLDQNERAYVLSGVKKRLWRNRQHA